MNKFLALMSVLALVGCGSNSGGSGGGNAAPTTDKTDKSGDQVTLSNDFSVEGKITIDQIATGINVSSNGTNGVSYIMRFIHLENSELFTGVLKFNINKDDNQYGHFSDVTLERYMKIKKFKEDPVSFIDSSQNLEILGALGNLNYIRLDTYGDRMGSLRMFFNKPGVMDNDTNDAAVIFSKDASTFVGGNKNWMFIAQKAQTASAISEQASDGLWKTLSFSAARGYILKGTVSLLNIGGLGPHSLKAFSGINESGSFKGEMKLMDALSGMYAYAYDYDPGSLSGMFLISPDTHYIYGIDFMGEGMFAGHK